MSHLTAFVYMNDYPMTTDHVNILFILPANSEIETYR